MRRSLTVLFMIMALALTALACNVGLNVPAELELPEVDITGEDIQTAATQAAVAVATAADVAATAADVAATAVSDGADLVATVEAQATAVVPPPGSDTAPVSPIGNLSTGDNLFTLTVSDAEFNQFLAQQSAGATSDLLRDPQVAFHDGIVTLTGDITQPLTAPLVANFTPTIANGRLQFTITDATVGGFPAPQSVLDLIQTNVNTAVDQAMTQLPAGVVMETVGLSGNVLTVTGLMTN